MVRTTIVGADGERIDLTKPENRYWRHRRTSPGTVSTVFAIVDVVTDAIVTIDEHEPEMGPYDLEIGEFAVDVREGDIVPVREENVPEHLKEAVEE